MRRRENNNIQTVKPITEQTKYSISDDRILEIAKDVLNESFEDWLYIETGMKGKNPNEKKTPRFRYPSNSDITDFDTAVHYCMRELNTMLKPTIPTIFGMNSEIKYNVFASMNASYPTKILSMKDLDWKDPDYTVGLSTQYISVAPIAVYTRCYDKKQTSFTTRDGIDSAVRIIRNIFKETFPQFSVIITEHGERYLPKDLIKDFRKQLIDTTKHKNKEAFEKQNIYVILKGIAGVADILYEGDGIKITEDDSGIYVTIDGYNGTQKKSYHFDKKDHKWKRRKDGSIPSFKNKEAAIALTKAIAAETNNNIKDLLSAFYIG